MFSGLEVHTISILARFSILGPGSPYYYRSWHVARLGHVLGRGSPYYFDFGPGFRFWTLEVHTISSLDPGSPCYFDLGPGFRVWTLEVHAISILNQMHDPLCMHDPLFLNDDTYIYIYIYI